MELQERPSGQRYQVENLTWYRVHISGDPDNIRALAQWVLDQPFEISCGWDFTYCLKYVIGPEYTLDEFLGFVDPNDAMLFKLSWQGIARITPATSYTQ
jgi:hypothetical protein